MTDHSEYVGTVRLANDPNSDISKLPIADKLKVRSKEDIMKVYLFLGEFNHEEPATPELTSPEWPVQRLEAGGRRLRTSIISRESSRPS